MADYTAEQYREAARKAYQAGDVATAKKLIARGMAASQTPMQEAASAVGGIMSGLKPADPSPMPAPGTKGTGFAPPESMLRSAVGGAVDMGTFGFGDEIAAGVAAPFSPKTYDELLAQNRGMLAKSQADNPGSYFAGQLAGAVALPVGAVGTTGGTVARVAKSAGAGAAMGGAYGFGSGEGGFQNRAREGAIGVALGAGVGAAVPAVAGGVGKLLEARLARQAQRAAIKGAPATEELRKAAAEAYKAVDNAGVTLNPAALQARLAEIPNALKAEGVGLDVGGKVYPAARGIMDATENFTAGRPSIPFSELEVLRRYMGAGAGSNPMNKSDTRLASQAISKLDEIVQSLGPGEVTAGDAGALQSVLPQARALYAKSARSQTIEDAIKAAEGYTSGLSSGIRNQFRSLVNSTKKSRGFSEAEKKAMRRAAGGTLAEQGIHLLGGGLGRIASTTAGFGSGGIGGAIGGAALGAGARKLSDAISLRRAEAVRALVASEFRNATPQKLSPEARKLIESLLRKAGIPAAVEVSSPVFAK